MKLKVALLNDQLNAGGAERVLVTIANLLHQKGIDVRVILFLDKSSLDGQLHKDIPVFYLKRKGRFDLKAMKLLKKYCNETDLVHIHSRYNLRYFTVAKYLTAIHKPKIVFHEHVPQYNNVDTFTLTLLRKVDAYVAVLKTICDWAISTAKIPQGKVYYLPNIVSNPVDNFNTGTYRQKKAIMVANFRRIKNHLFAIELLKQLGDGFTLDLYGVADEQDYYQEVLETINKQNLQQKVNIINGVNNIYEVLPQYHFAIHTASNETGPLVLLEYLKAGLPFLTFKTGDVVNNIKNEIPEMVVETFEIEDWKNKVETVIVNGDKRATLQQKMKRIAETKFSSEAYINTLLDIYNKTVYERD